ncbi:hypothetical protein Hanom_Chr09g00759721 [Helianthus anomalus]
MHNRQSYLTEKSNALKTKPDREPGDWPVWFTPIRPVLSRSSWLYREPVVRPENQVVEPDFLGFEPDFD